MTDPIGPVYPHNATTGAGTGGWSDLINIYSDDDLAAAVVLFPGGAYSQVLSALDFRPAFPPGFAITKLVVRVDGASTVEGGGSKDTTVQLVKGGALVGPNKAIGHTFVPGGEDVYYTWTAADLAAAGMDMADFEASDSGVGIIMQHNDVGHTPFCYGCTTVVQVVSMTFYAEGRPIWVAQPCGDMIGGATPLGVM